MINKEVFFKYLFAILMITTIIYFIIVNGNFFFVFVYGISMILCYLGIYYTYQMTKLELKISNKYYTKDEVN